MRDLDFAAWRAVDHGERELDWSVWLGRPEHADHLTATGRVLIPRMVSDLTAFFGSRWLHRAAYPDPQTGRQLVPGLGRFAPTLASSDRMRPGAFIEAVRWWAPLQLLEGSQVLGVRSVRNDARKDVRAARLFHTLTQTRLAAMGTSLGADVTLEPPTTGGPGDVLLKVPGTELFIEVVTLSPESKFTQQDEYTNRHRFYLHALEGRLPVYFEGDVPGFLHKAEEERWVQKTKEVAVQCAQTGRPVELSTGETGFLVVKPGPVPPGTELIGPFIESDQGSRLVEVIRKKGVNTQGAGLAWIWVEDHGGLHPTTEFFRRPLAEQLDAMRNLTKEIFDGYRHIAGIIYSYAHQRAAPLPPDGQAQRLDGYALQRGLPIDRVRRTFIVTRRLSLPTPTEFLVKMCDQEPYWLDRTLARLHVADSAQALLVPPPGAAARRSPLWTPP
ncbi:hypothetical protein [Actinomadura sp. 7K507]|uniref:hypothetical protein n=1 Tax=Actinomadura sp. 7K507 TaxID=2530365 RepID=UPI001048A3B8|nr:hypothetical protein [Actinomadura sp. 7K507]TDC89577.1 hypothetical protein E1285_16205 [Actinomadura sp. 7K507]